MVIAAELSARAGLLPNADAARIRKVVARAGLPVAPPNLAEERWRDLMSLDKKTAGGKVRFVLLERLGKAALKAGVEPGLVRESIVAAAQ
jgi:3-dehydroquinate synthase